MYVWLFAVFLGRSVLLQALYTISHTLQGYWTTRGFANSRIRQLADCQLADWTFRGLVNSRTRQLAYWTSRRRDNLLMPSATLHA